ncbi:MAG: 16S rRNA (guanine(527)-N(7))-methyltransferase RsmG [Microbacteriaceae bacterium]
MIEYEAEPTAATELFVVEGSLDKARAYTRNLAENGETLGLIGPLELPRLWTRHVLNSAVLASLLKPGRVGDVGSGAGLPGLVLAIARPDVQLVLIEPMERRVAWLEQQVNELGLENVEVVRARAEDVMLYRALDQVTARAVSALRTLIPLTARLVREGGELLLLKGAGAERELEAAEKAIRKYKLSNVEVLELGTGVITEPTRVVRATVN